ncbi:hypothetical protein [Paenibacillus flagellatus]|nr:hypothetical protein [Paenibacillus flagellatus]
MKRYYVFDFPLEMYGIGLLFGVALLAIVFAAYRRTRKARGSGD